MSEFIYLMKNGDLYKIGCTRNLKAESNKLKPGEIISFYQTSDSKSFQARLLRMYKRKRIPETNYFRLCENEVDDCKKHLEGKSNLPKNLSDEFKIGLNGALLFSVVTFLSSFFINKMLILSLFISTIVGSIPMWLLAILGNFGGYDTYDLSLFSTVSNRLKGFLIAISMVSFSYVLYTLFKF